MPPRNWCQELVPSLLLREYESLLYSYPAEKAFRLIVEGFSDRMTRLAAERIPILVFPYPVGMFLSLSLVWLRQVKP